MKCLGLMSGTSADGVDCAIVEITPTKKRPKITLLSSQTRPYPPSLRKQVLLAPTHGKVAELCHLNAAVGEVFAQTALQTIKQANLTPKDIRLIGSHGQTVYHQPNPIRESKVGLVRSTLQIGDPAIIAERTGITTVADFRTRDMAAGGEGAPLAPYVHHLLFQSKRQSRLVVNLGGIGNVTFLSAKGGLEDVRAFDTGPCNMLLDGLVLKWTSGKHQMDRNGRLGRRGQCHDSLLKTLLSHPYLEKRPPKSTGREEFGDSYIKGVLRQAKAKRLSLEDILATCCAFVARTILDACEVFHGNVEEVICGGGGVKNFALMEALRKELEPRVVGTMDQLGVDSKAFEALAFAVMAYQTIQGIPANVPSVSGARHAVVLGAVVPGKTKISIRL
ncbi:anhydro-N-acetylmuramic acid kinase [Candidatus Nitronereus thalassa]|uniref:Anhydro-N-acetylmuramic acid kinase n=1 Tax=Candidatus Nitronereus thalassa TaxID=3020898 RepID=A0ABU3KA46_9BACT|nr:anhydro-N-acetylmuramic acid kinase [Candidatus Nitronereus thalassa]MDT7043290.1 anhydro-N-acetylmuramic acid kinase [Candidatus Nitronereus thalassa]